MLPYGGASAPAGWLLCYGQSLLRASYVDLFAAIGTAYGAADGTHFSIPDLRGRVPAGKDDMGGSAASRLTSTTMTPDGVTLAAVGGAQTHTLITSELAVHSHTPTDPGHTHTATPSGATGNSTVGSGGAVLALTSASGISVAFATTGITIGNAGSGAAHNNVQPSIITNYIIYAGV
jgi:microcystin-dependent protein